MNQTHIFDFASPADGAERFRRTLREGSKENRLIDKFDRGDYKDYYEYHDGPEGDIGDECLGLMADEYPHLYID